MNDLTPIENQGQRVLTTEQLAELYGTTPDRIADNFKKNRDKFIEGSHFFKLEGPALKDFKNKGLNSPLVGKNAKSLILYTKRGAARHSKMLGTDQAWDVFDSLEENYFNPQPKLLVPQSLPEALRLAADLAEQKDQERSGRLIAEQQVQEMKPKADYYDMILASKGLVTITSIAKNYGMSARMFNAILHSLGVQYKQSGSWYLYSEYQGYGYTHTVTVPYVHSDGRVDIQPSTKWTQKGHKFIYDFLKARGILPVIERETEEAK
jgi:phage antirepressor YoqD-like protein